MNEAKGNNRRPFSWTQRQIEKLNKVLNIILELEEFKPLTLRQIYYQLVGSGFIENSVSQYGMLSKLLKHARIDGLIPWVDIEDRVRSYYELSGWKNAEKFLTNSLNQFLNNYRRDLTLSQDVYLEIWIEKDALSSIFTRVASQYTVPVVVCRGFSSVSFLNDYKMRLSTSQSRRPVLLYFGDFDPSGVEMLKSMEITLKDELKVEGIEFKRIALQKEDIDFYKLPHSPEALKKNDTRAKKHIAMYGELAVELDALPPSVLQNKIKMAIENELDMDLFMEEKETEVSESSRLRLIKSDVSEFVEGLL